VDLTAWVPRYKSARRDRTEVPRSVDVGVDCRALSDEVGNCERRGGFCQSTRRFMSEPR